MYAVKRYETAADIKTIYIVKLTEKMQIPIIQRFKHTTKSELM